MKKLLSLYLSVMLVLSAIFVPVGTGFTAFAEETVSKVAIAKKELTTNDLHGQNPWDGGALSTQNSETGGIKFTYANGFCNVRLGIKDGSSLDGMYLKVNNITRTSGTIDPKLLFVFSSSLEYNGAGGYGKSAHDGMFSLLLDTQNGVLKVVRDAALSGADEKEDVIITSDTLKYENIAGKVVIIRSFANTDGGYDITVNVGTDRTLTGTITAEIMAKSTAFTGHDIAMLTVHAGAPQNPATNRLSMSFDLVEYCNIPNTTGEETVDKVGIVKKELTVSDVAGKNDWLYSYSTEASPTGGVKFSFLNAFSNMRLAIADRISLDGMYLKLNNITSINGVTPKILFVFSSSYDNYAQPVYANMFALQLDTEAGALKVVRDNLTGNNEDVIITNDNLKKDYISGKVVIIRSLKNENGGYDISIKIGSDEEITSTITSEVLAKSTAFKAYDTAYITVHPGVNQDSFSSYMSAQFDFVECCTIAESEGTQEQVAITRKALTTADVAGTNHWPAKLTTENAATGGIKFTFTDSHRNIRLGVNDAAALDGMYLKLNNITSLNGSIPRMLFVFSGTKDDEARDGMFSLLLDTQSGKLKVVRDRNLLSQTGREDYLQHEDVIIERDNLKYDYIKGKVVIIRTYLNADGGYDLTVKVGNDNVLTGTLTAEIMAKSTAFNAKHIMYLALHAGVCQDSTADYASMSVDVVEFCTVPKVFGDKVAVEGKELTVSDVTGTNHWPAMIATESSYNGGVKFTFANAFRNVTLGFDEVASLDGMYLKLNNITKLESADPRIMFVLSTSPAAQTAKGMFALVLDTENGELKVVRDKDLYSQTDRVLGENYYQDADVIISENDNLKYENIKGKVVVIRSFDNYQGGFDISVKIGNDDEIVGTITADIMEKSTALTNYDNVYLSVHSGVAQDKAATGIEYATMSFDVVEYWSPVEVVEGDLNGDGEFNASDIVCIRKYLFGTAQENFNEAAADLNYDGRVDIIDLVVMKKAFLKLPNIIDNSDLMPEWYATTKNDINADNIPNWADDLIIGEVNIATATSAGTLEAAEVVLDHYAEMGVNGIWLTPVSDNGSGSCGYGNLGIDTIAPSITGKDDYDEGWAELKAFIDKAHEKNIRVILDIVFRGVLKESPLVEAHPDWFEVDETYSGWMKFKWQDTTVNSVISDWYKDNVVAIAYKTGCDGFRYDMMPTTTQGTTVEKAIVDSLKTHGKYMFIMSESENDRKGLYATEQVSILEALSAEAYTNPTHYFLNKYDIVDFIHNGSEALNGKAQYKYYTYSLANHDNKTTVVNGNRLAVGYQAMFAPFIPLMYLGEEFNNPHNSTTGNVALFYNTIDWSNISKNRAFYEDIKAMIRIRRTYSDLFGNFTDRLIDTNICKVESNAEITAYARYAGNKAAIIVPNNSYYATDIELNINLSDLRLAGYTSYTVKDAETGRVVASGNASSVSSLTVNVAKMDQSVLIIEAK